MIDNQAGSDGGYVTDEPSRGETSEVVTEPRVTSATDDEPRYATSDAGGRYCQDCGCAVEDEFAHTRFHSILSSHGWTLAVLQNTHLSAITHDRYNAVERIKRRTSDNWSADAFAEVTGIEASDA